MRRARSQDRRHIEAAGRRECGENVFRTRTEGKALTGPQHKRGGFGHRRIVSHHAEAIRHDAEQHRAAFRLDRQAHWRDLDRRDIRRLTRKASARRCAVMSIAPPV